MIVADGIDSPQHPVVRVGDDHLAVDPQSEVVRMPKQGCARGTAVARVALLAVAGDRAHDPVRVDEPNPVVVLGDDDALVVVDLEPADSAEGRCRRRSAVTCVAALPVSGDEGLPPAGHAVDPVARGDVEAHHVVVREADDVTQTGDGDPALACAQVDAHDAIQLPVGDEEVVPGVVVRERPRLHDLDGPGLALRVRGGDAQRDQQQESEDKGP